MGSYTGRESPPAQRHRCSLSIGLSSSLLVHFVSHLYNLPEVGDQIMVIVQVIVLSQHLVGRTMLNVCLGVNIRTVPAAPQVC